MRLEPQIRAAAARLGFARCGLARLGPPPHADAVRAWIAAGHGAGMEYLARGLAPRLDPTRVLPGARSIVSVAVPYRPAPPPPDDLRAALRGRVAAYALGPDYHDTIGRRLAALVETLRGLCPDAGFRAYVDTGPVLEREWAAQAGVGWVGRNTMLLTPGDGSWLLLGEVVTTLDLEPDTRHPDRCGTCARCLVGCPTGALAPGYVLDARRCIAYWTIEHRGTIPPAVRPTLGSWVFGCDECQTVCPWTPDAAAADAREATEALYPRLPGLLRLDAAGFRRRFRGTTVFRTGRVALARNAAVALGNGGDPAAVPALAEALRADPSWVVRAHAAWALGRIGGAGARAALAAAYAREPAAPVRAEIVAAL